MHLPGHGIRTAHTRNHMDADARSCLVAQLRRTIDRICDVQPRMPKQMPETAENWCTGITEIDRFLPDAKLDRHALHEVVAAQYGDAPAALGFAASLTARAAMSGKPDDRRPVLWVRALGDICEYGRLYGHGLARFGITHDRLLTVSLRKPQAVLWTVEEALRSAAVSMVVCDAHHARFDLTATRRAMLAANSGQVPCLMVFTHPRDGATAAHTRWQVASAPSTPSPYDCAAPGHPAWHISLTRSRGGRPGNWTVEWQHAAYRFSLVSLASDRTAEQSPQGTWGGQPVAVSARALRAGNSRA